LRRELGRLLGAEPRLLGRESLEFLLMLEALRHGGAEARSVALDPAQCLQALDDLGRAGWSGEEADLGEVPSPARDWLRVLAHSGAWAPSIDRELSGKSEKWKLASGNSAPSPAAHLCFWAWDAELGAERTLLAAALAAARDTVFFLPSPLEDAEFDWVAALEQWCGAGAEVCAESGFVSANDELTARLFRRGEELPVKRLPALLVGGDEEDELALLERRVWQCLEDDGAGGDGGQIGVVFPPRSTLARRLAGRLLAAGLPVADRIGHARPVDGAAAAQQKLVNYYLYGCQVDDFLALVTAWRLHGGGIEPARLRRRRVQNVPGDIPASFDDAARRQFLDGAPGQDLPHIGDAVRDRMADLDDVVRQNALVHMHRDRRLV
jgi:hypothetical protein